MMGIVGILCRFGSGVVLVFVDYGMVVMVEMQVDKLGRPADAERQPDYGHNSNPRLFHLSLFLPQPLDIVGVGRYYSHKDNALSLSDMDNNSPLSLCQGDF
jgi:hypothetical protein